MGASIKIATIFTHQYVTLPRKSSDIDIFIGDEDIDGDYTTGNVKCLTASYYSGFVACEGTGRYLIFQVVNPHSTFNVGELYAW